MTKTKALRLHDFGLKYHDFLNLLSYMRDYFEKQHRGFNDVADVEVDLALTNRVPNVLRTQSA